MRTITTKIPEDLMILIRQLAKEENRTIIGQLRQMIKFYMEKKDAK